MPSDSEPRTETTLLDLARNPQMPDRALPTVSLGEIRDAIEQARGEALEDVAERVRGLPDGSLANSHGGAVLHGLVSRAAVLALLSTKEEGS